MIKTTYYDTKDDRVVVIEESRGILTHHRFHKNGMCKSSHPTEEVLAAYTDFLAKGAPKKGVWVAVHCGSTGTPRQALAVFQRADDEGAKALVEAGGGYVEVKFWEYGTAMP